MCQPSTSRGTGQGQAGQYTLTIRRIEATYSPDARVEQLMAGYDERTPRGVIMVICPGAVVFSRGDGMAHLEHRVAKRPRTIYNLASISKMFTGFAIAILVTEGTLSLDEDVRKYVAECPDFGREITLHHLISHTTGPPGAVESLGVERRSAGGRNPPGPCASADRGSGGVEFRPWSGVPVQNTGYTMLAEMVERATSL
jgi:CubicO group peptidase (beta-lactamase class C family)